MTTVHHFLAIVLVVVTVALLAAAAWSTTDARRSGGAIDHRFAVDRLILAVTAIFAIEGVIGMAIALVVRGPTDPLHLLYGPLALIALPVGRWFGASRQARAADIDGGAARSSRRDLWVVVAAVILLGLELRLFATG
ncbi:MAG: hypothetical protein H0T59_05735 [Chloroflexi bacterium]|nr:hypothetical protein [Chloroflexota bacterium]